MLTIVGQGFPDDPDLVCALAVPSVGDDAFGPQPLLAQGLRVISASPDMLVARVSGVAPWTSSGQIMVAVGNGSTNPMPPGIPPSLTVLAPGAWTWQADGGPTAVSPQSVDFLAPSLVTCTDFYGQVVNGQLRITISGNAALCPTGTTLRLQADVATTTQQWVIDQFIQVQTNQPRPRRAIGASTSASGSVGAVMTSAWSSGLNRLPTRGSRLLGFGCRGMSGAPT